MSIGILAPTFDACDLFFLFCLCLTCLHGCVASVSLDRNKFCFLYISKKTCFVLLEQTYSLCLLLCCLSDCHTYNVGPLQQVTHLVLVIVVNWLQLKLVCKYVFIVYIFILVPFISLYVTWFCIYAHEWLIFKTNLWLLKLHDSGIRVQHITQFSTGILREIYAIGC